MRRLRGPVQRGGDLDRLPRRAPAAVAPAQVVGDRPQPAGPVRDLRAGALRPRVLRSTPRTAARCGSARRSSFGAASALELAEGYSEVSIGAGTAFTYEVVIQCGRRIEIGERCFFGQATMIVDGDHRFRDLDRPIAEQGYDLRPVTIADDVWAGAKCTIMAGVGARTVVGANSVVTRDLPPYVVAVGRSGAADRLLRAAGRRAERALRLGLLPGGEEVGRQLLTVVEVGAAPGARRRPAGSSGGRSGSGSGRGRRPGAGGPRG